jgi:hypothetical protein
MQLTTYVFSLMDFCYIPKAFAAQWNFLVGNQPLKDNLKEFLAADEALCIVLRLYGLKS